MDGTLADSLEFASWNRQRTVEELRSFVDRHHELLPADIDVK